MEDLFNMLSGSARINKLKRKKQQHDAKVNTANNDHNIEKQELGKDVVLTNRIEAARDNEELKSRDRTGKRDNSKEKLDQIRKEQVNAFRRSMLIKLANKHDPSIPDPISSFHELIDRKPYWWSDDFGHSYVGILRSIQRNIEAGKWKEPTPIQMQAIPSLLQRRDFIGAAPTGSGKSGSFIIPALVISSAPYEIFYASEQIYQLDDQIAKIKKNPKTKSYVGAHRSNREGEIRALLLAPSSELASQLHREVERLGTGKPGSLSSVVLSKSNAAQIISGTSGGKKGVDILVSTPLRLVDSIEKGLKLNTVRVVVLDEADRLLDSSDGKTQVVINDKSSKEAIQYGNSSGDYRRRNNIGINAKQVTTSGSAQSKSFLSQIDAILSEIPSTAIRCLFSATITPTVRSLAESILRNPIDITIATSSFPGGANPDIEQELMFVGKEDGKLLAIRQLAHRGELRPPVLIFLESQERAQALFGELLYDGIHVDVIHAGRSKAAREHAVMKFRRGDTWVLICTDLVSRGVDFRAVNMVINYDLPASGITYVHRIGRTGRAGRKGTAITLFTEADFDNLRTIANVMKQSGCNIEEWMLNLPKSKLNKNRSAMRRRQTIDTTPSYDKKKRHKKLQMSKHSKKKKAENNL